MMGAFGTPRLMWLFVAATIALLLAAPSQAESKVDSDLVFDNLEQTDLTNHENHHRIAKDSPFSDESSLDSSPPVEEHWLSSTVNRIKRSINSFLSTKSKSSHKRNHVRVPRQNSQGDVDDYDDEDEDLNEDEDGYDENEGDDGYGEDEDNDGNIIPDDNNYEDEDDDYDDEEENPDEYTDQDVEPESDDSTTTTAAPTTTTTTTTIPTTPPTTTTETPYVAYVPTESAQPVDGNFGIGLNEPDAQDPFNRTSYFGGVDDEDNLINSGEHSSGEPGPEIPSVGGLPTHPVYYRISFTVNEPFIQEFSDRNSFRYIDFSGEIVREIDSLYRSVPGDQTANVVKIERRDVDAFTSRVTVDLVSMGYNNERVIRSTIYEQIANNHRLGNLAVRPDDFQFRAFGDDRRVVCDENQLSCHSGECVPSEARCNRTFECSDRSDEMGCDVFAPSSTAPPFIVEPDDLGSGDLDTTPQPPTTSSTSSDRCRADDVVRCEDGSRVICADQKCDGVRDCDDGGDERDCFDCAQGEIICDITRCIPENKVCDGTPDCTDETDERGCTVCTADQIQCDNECFPLSKRCDGYPDCKDGRDEEGCQDSQCRPNYFSCGDGQCIPQYLRCDRQRDCRNGQDEANCTDCTANEFSCGDSCVDISFRCDGFKDCKNGRDEEGCSSCREDEHDCGNNRCIPEHMVCDGATDCENGSDEVDCPPALRCTSSEFQCDSGDCIPKYLQCSGSPECPDGSDERDCQCRPDQFQCSNGVCIAGSLRCNRRNDCSDGSDEYNCPTQPPPPVTESPTQRPTSPPPLTCATGYQPCYSGDRCILRSQLCDGRVDCNDMSDETNCPGPSDGLNLRTYPNAQEIKENREVVFQCRDEGPLRARVRWTRPNGEPLPPGSRDLNGRLEMPNIKVEHGGTYVCEAIGYPPSTPGAQVTVHLQVDRWTTPTPPRPPSACRLEQATCSNGDCISKDLVCDGKYDCTDGSDENRCNPNGCEPNEFRCANKKCILKTWRCDADDDCGDGSDEENCATNPPGSLCAYHQFACHSNNQCIPRSYHCDLERDCIDGSDEIGCSLPVISKPPPPMVNLQVHEVFEISCTAVGMPVPEVVWRLNWGHIPPKCRTTSVNGVGTLTCPDIQVEDQGAYSCEAINIKGTKFAVPDTILVVNQPSVCRPGYFNDEARTEAECIKCFCFGQSSKCRSADLFIYQFQPPFDTLKLLGVRVDPVSGAVEVRDEPIYRNAQPQLSPLGRNGVFSQLPAYGELSQPNLVPYFAMPENYHGNQLKSYGGFLRFTIRHNNRGYPVRGPTAILTGNGYTLLSRHEETLQPNRNNDVEIRFFEGEWVKRVEGRPETTATREEIMMTLAGVNNILIKLQYSDGPLNTTVTGIEMDSAAAPNSGLGQALFVEECECPVGYTGTSCERCADGYERHSTGPWLGQCYRQPTICPPGTYGDVSRGIPCEVCPCPLTSPSNQFARTCSLASDGGVTCDCPVGYEGRRCEQCAPGYSGNPLVPGDSCRITAPSYCNAEGTAVEEQGRCRCKNNVDGATCSSCKPNTFYLNGETQFGCIACFCMGVTNQCSSSNWYRDQISTSFTTSRNNFKLIDTERREVPIEQGIIVDSNRREIVYQNFGNPNVHYWSLPPRYLGNKITAYGGYLRYTLRYVPVPGGQSSRNSAADVELVSANQIVLLYYAREQAQPSGTPQTFVVPLLEQYWQRSDGQKADREHLLMALADLEAIYIKATYTTNTRESALISVSLDTANERNTGSGERALAVEQCFCPPGYNGLSCEDCAPGYTRGIGGLYLGLCEPCNCNGNANECDPEDGQCYNCRNFTTGENCEQCLPGYEGNPVNRIPCRAMSSLSTPSPCTCDPRGSISGDCYGGSCQCKTNVEGSNCDRCRPGTFGLEAGNIEGCQVCFCSGVTTECLEGNFFYEQIPTEIIDPEGHGFSLTDQYQRRRIETSFQINPLMNEIGYTFIPSDTERWYWALPRKYTGNQIHSYGGRLEFTQRYTQRPQARYIPDQDVVIIGSGITIYWSNPQSLTPDVANKVSVVLNPSANWQRLDSNAGPRPASREDIMTVLANIEVILIRARLSSDTESTYISDVTLDTAIEQASYSQGRTNQVEVCRCPQGYRGSSCESCAAGYYRDTNDYRTGPLGSCSRCPCSSHEESCNLGPDNRIICNCLPGYIGRQCEFSDSPTTANPGNVVSSSTPPPIQFEITITSPEIEIYEVGSSVSINCSARSFIGRPLRVQWTKEGGQLPNHALDDGDGYLVITDLRVSDSGRYICQVFDGISVDSRDITIRVGTSTPVPPRVAISPSFVDVQMGQPIQIQCTASGNPTPNLRLIRLDGQELNPAYYFQNGMFRIQQALRSDQGPYQCIATNTAGTHTANVDVYVRDDGGPSIVVEISPTYYEGETGRDFTLNCHSNRGGTTKWSRQNAPLPYNSAENNGELIVYSPRVEDQGTYICTVTILGAQSATGSVEVRIRDVETGTSPTAKVNPERITISQGSSAELRCDATGYPPPTIKWTKVGSELPSHIEQIGPVLHIRSARFDDRGVYVCVTSNGRGLAQASAIVEVDQVETPVVSIYPQSTQTVSVGGGAYLQCRAEAGIPSPTLTWTRANGAPLSANIEVMSEGVLRFNDITPNEAGEYICTAENTAGRATGTATIEVQQIPEVWIVPDERMIQRRAGESIRLECHARGAPLPNVHWRKYGETRVPTSALASERGGSAPRDVAILEIGRFSEQDQGLYICEARNTVGYSEKRIELVILSLANRGDIVGNRSHGDEDGTGLGGNEITPPDGGYKINEPNRPPPRQPGPPVHRHDETFKAPVGTRAELRCQVNNNYDRDTIYVNWGRTDNTSLPSNAFVRGGTLYIDNVQPPAGGEYRCIGVHHPTGQVVFTVTVQLDVISPPRIVLVPPRQVVHPGDNAYIQCTATGQQPITIRWLPVGRSMPSSVNTRDGLIQFNNIQLTDAGRYRCTAVNSAGEADAVADVIVEENIHRPALTAENRHQRAPLGSSITLRCRAHDSNVINNIRWFRQDVPLPRNSVVDGEYLRITNLQQEDRGRYFCEIPHNGGFSSDFIDLDVTNERWYCGRNEWHCRNGQCIPQTELCNGYDNCGDNSDEENCITRKRRGPSSVTVPPPTLYISPAEANHRIGESFDITCQSSEPGVITTWSKVPGWLASNVQSVGGTLRFLSLRPENSGIYRCEATGREGLYHKDYNLTIIDQHDVKDEPPLEIKTAPQGSSIILECRTDLEQPVTYFWSKQGGNLPSNVDIYSRSIRLDEISSADAGIYICTQTKGTRSIESPIVLVVTGIVPHFAQAPTSYLELNTLPDAYIQFNFEISFKPQNSDGLILYNGNKGNDRSGDFISLALNNGVPEFRFMLGHAPTVVRADRPITKNEWHTVKVIRYKKKVTMFVDGQGPYIGTAEGKYIGLDLSERLYLGGVPNFDNISPEANVYTGFVGCISRFKIGFSHQDIIKQARVKEGITTCETCSENRCENQGVCQEAMSPEGYTCICPAGYSGPTCNKLKGEACSPYACGTGRCIDTENSFDCLCPIGRAGRRCEREITINEPAFSNDAYIAYQTPKLQRRLKVSLKIKPSDAKDGMLLYCAETDEGHGDFVSLALRNRHVEFTFNVGGRTTIIRSDKEVRPGEWHVLTASRSSSEGRLIVDGVMASGGTPGNHKALNLLTPLYVGGYDKQNIKLNSLVAVRNGFNGCVSEISVSGMELSIVESATEGANIEDCSALSNDVDNEIEYAHENAPQVPPTLPYDSSKTGCSDNPCRNNGICYPLSPMEYRCSCLEGYTGRDCETTLPNQCDSLPCQNGGSCQGNTTLYDCSCYLGYTGRNCEQRITLRNDAHFDGNGYLEFDRSLLAHRRDNEEEVIAFELSTNSSNGLIFWHGQTPNEPGDGQDYIALGIVNGYLEFSYDLGTGPVIIRNGFQKVDDGQRYNVILKRRGRHGSIDIGNVYMESGDSPGSSTSLNTLGNIYLGGTPNIELMTANRFNQGFSGCIHGFELQNSNRFDLGSKAISGINVKPCSSFYPDIYNNFDDNELEAN